MSLCVSVCGRFSPQRDDVDDVDDDVDDDDDAVVSSSGLPVGLTV